MFKRLYLSPLGYFISVVQNIFSRIFTPFMVYGYWNIPTRNFRKNTRISSTVVMLDKRNIDIGDNCWIWHHSIIDGSNGVTIGSGVQIGAWVGIFSHGSQVAIRLHGENYINIDKNHRIGYLRAPVSIGDYTFIGAGACILPGVVVGRGCVIAAGAVLNKNCPDFAIMSGNPAKIIGSTLDLDSKYFHESDVQRDYFDREVIRNFLNDSKSISVD